MPSSLALQCGQGSSQTIREKEKVKFYSFGRTRIRQRLLRMSEEANSPDRITPGKYHV